MKRQTKPMKPKLDAIKVNQHQKNIEIKQVRNTFSICRNSEPNPTECNEKQTKPTRSFVFL